MAEITKPIALDESFNTTEGSPRNVADVLAQGIGDLVTVVSRISHQTTYDELSDLEDVNISAPTNGDVLTYDGSKWVNGQGGGGSSCEELIAPVETGATASQAYAIGEQFILNGTLYTATAAITAGGTITINGNCTASDSVTEQINNIKQGESVSVTADGIKTYQQVLNNLFALLDTTKITYNSYIKYGNYIYRLTLIMTGLYQFTVASIASSNTFIQKISVSASSGCERISGSTFTDLTSQVPTNGATFTIYY